MTPTIYLAGLEVGKNAIDILQRSLTNTSLHQDWSMRVVEVLMRIKFKPEF